MVRRGLYQVPAAADRFSGLSGPRHVPSWLG